LHTLDLLSAQQNCSVAATIDAIQREIALPVDDVLASAQLLSSRLAGSDSESLIRKMVESVRLVKEQVSKVGREMGMQASTKVGPLATIPDPPLRHKRILVVDGDERMRRQAHLVMGRLGAIVETTGTAEEGLAMAAGSAYDTIFMDIRPPDLGGYETYRRLRDACPGVQVAMTTGFGYDSGHAIVKARQDGMQFVLFKPYRPDQVIRAVLTPALPRGTTAPGSNSTNGTVAPVGGAY
jgi:CheY-like chemotaxis protein